MEFVYIIIIHYYNKVRTQKSQTIEALDIVIPELKKRGYKFVTISELVGRIDHQVEKKK